MFNPEKGQQKSESGVIEYLASKETIPKFLRVLALGGSVAFALQAALSEAEETTSPYSVEQVENELGIKEAVPGSRVEVVKKGEKYIVNIFQIHSDVSFEVTKKSADQELREGLGRIIRNQKHVESVIKAFVDEQHVAEVSVELTPGVWAVNDLKALMSQVDSLQKDDDPGLITDFLELKYNDVVNNPDILDCQKGPILYLLAQSLKPYAETSQQASSLYNDISSNRLIAGDNVYVWGGATKLFIEGTINIKVVESENEISGLYRQNEAYNQSNLSVGFDLREVVERYGVAGYSSEEQIEKGIEFVSKHRASIDLRESASLEKILQGTDDNNTYKLVVYGLVHDFSNNVDQYNLQHDTNIGLINIGEIE